MAQRSHVPKFGNWDGDNVPYTVYFENARKEKGGGVRRNPNDPEENPDLFMFGVGGASVSHSVQPPLQVNSEKSTSTESSQIEGHKPSHHRKVSNHHKNGSQKSMTSGSGSEKSNSDHSVQPPLQVNSEKSTSTESSQIEGHKPSHHRKVSNHHKNGSQKSMTSGSGSEKSNSDNSIHQANHRRKRSDRKKSTNEGSNSNIFCPPSPGPNRFRSGTNPLEDTSLRAASVPMFGAWDERDPKSGEGFTVIFNKVKEEKQIAASTFPPVPAQPINQPNNQETNTKSKRWCCLF